MSDTRDIQHEIEIDAPIEAVWKALTDADELKRWFPIDAEIKPGAGGWIRSIWREVYNLSENIEIWEPNKRLRTVWGPIPGSDDEKRLIAMMEEAKAKGQPPPFPPNPIKVDYTLETRGGKTVLRLVHSGFGADAMWDEQYDGTRRGWRFMFRGLRHYLEQHRGTPRQALWVMHMTRHARPAVWAKLMSGDGLFARGSIEGLGAGDAYRFETPDGDVFEGRVDQHAPPKDFEGTVANLNHAYARFQVDAMPGPEAKSMISILVSTYGMDAAVVEALEGRMGARLRGLFE
jgi:uncharacterized protein YndB with AHSA1/START domain